MYGLETVGVSPCFSLSHSFYGGFMPTKELSVEEILHPIELHYQRSIPEMVLDWTKELVTRLQEDYDSNNYTSDRYKFEIQTGRKYHKIVAKNQGVHAFVNKTTGEVFKPASYKAPAKHVRYDLRRIKDRQRCFSNADWAGGYLYLR